MTALRPAAAAIDQASDPVVTPAASASPERRPEAMEVPAMASVAGPGLAVAISAASRMRARFTSPSMDIPGLASRDRPHGLHVLDQLGDGGLAHLRELLLQGRGAHRLAAHDEGDLGRDVARHLDVLLAVGEDLAAVLLHHAHGLADAVVLAFTLCGRAGLGDAAFQVVALEGVGPVLDGLRGGLHGSLRRENRLDL